MPGPVGPIGRPGDTGLPGPPGMYFYINSPYFKHVNRFSQIVDWSQQVGRALKCSR